MSELSEFKCSYVQEATSSPRQLTEWQYLAKLALSAFEVRDYENVADVFETERKFSGNKDIVLSASEAFEKLHPDSRVAKLISGQCIHWTMMDLEPDDFQWLMTAFEAIYMNKTLPDVPIEALTQVTIDGKSMHQDGTGALFEVMIVPLSPKQGEQPQAPMTLTEWEQSFAHEEAAATADPLTATPDDQTENTEPRP